ncbi:hypothetical protein NDN08_007026 [Rhodosorus marinus]|uniref:Rubisco accumulation factor 1 C-terminal domain-containing protein n=1 Tax=Rhodosorus marinus TaxID=101924 RepID=A0AAV8UFD8_9RHOD|nr:hypothetical protein NDN08_007026 [Rhodosorus marinus]
MDLAAFCFGVSGPGLKVSRGCSDRTGGLARLVRRGGVRVRAEDEVERMRQELEKLKQENLNLKGAVEEKIELSLDDLIKKHGQGSRFMPFVKVELTDHTPRVVPYLGKLEDTNAESVIAAGPFVKKQKQGSITISEEGSFSNGLIGLPGSVASLNLSDPIAISVPFSPPDVDIATEDAQDSIAIIERNEGAFDNDLSSVYLYNTSEGLKLGYLEDEADKDQVQCLGEVAFAYSKSMIEIEEPEPQGESF